jgi:hypothetical protein
MLARAAYLEQQHMARCGVIPYTLIDGKLYFLLARHKPSRELSDFGGGVRKYEHTLFAGAREFMEESRGIFAEIYKSSDDLSRSMCIVDKEGEGYSKGMAIIFVYLSSGWYTCAQEVFSSVTPTRRSADEVSELKWVDESTFIRLIYSNHTSEIMWSRIQTLLKRGVQQDICSLLKRLSIGSRVGSNILADSRCVVSTRNPGMEA